MLCGQAASESLDLTLGLLEARAESRTQVSSYCDPPPVALVTAAPGPLEPSLVYLLDKSPMKLTKTRSLGFKLTNPDLAREPQSPPPTLKGISIRSGHLSACSPP